MSWSEPVYAEVVVDVFCLAVSCTAQDYYSVYGKPTHSQDFLPGMGGGLVRQYRKSCSSLKISLSAVRCCKPVNNVNL